jgi:uncharacterized membrane protein (DUF4010 family)
MAGRIMNPLILKLGLALAIGLLVGLERGWRERDAPAGSRTAGIRTYGISGLLGGALAALAEATHDTILLPAGFVAFAAAFAWFKWQEAEQDNDFSLTGVAAALTVFALGGLAVAGDQAAAAAAGAALAALLASRDMLHGLLKRLSWVEVRSAVVLAVMTAIILPLLPNAAIDPWGALNPREIWLFTLLAAALSYLGYIATRILGPTRGLLLGCLAGSMVSSTAMTLALARTEGSSRRLAGAACLAAMVSILRVAAMVLVLAPNVVPVVGPVALTAGVAFGLIGLIMFGRAGDRDLPASSDRNPFDLAPLMAFAGLFGIVSVAGTLVARNFGSASLVATSALSGAIDVDVGVLSALHFDSAAMPVPIVGQAVLAALAANAVVRLAIALAAGPRNFGLPLAVANGAAAAASIAVFLLVRSF